LHSFWPSEPAGHVARAVRWIRADGAGEAQPLLESKVELEPYSFSPDGGRLGFAERSVDTGLDLWTSCPWRIVKGWSAADLEAKLGDFQQYYNGYRTHSALAGNVPLPESGPSKFINVGSHRWRRHCGGLYQTPIAA